MGREVARWRAAPQSEGLRAGERVAILLRNGPDWAMCHLASRSLGLAVVPLDTDDRPEGAAHILQDAAARLLVVQYGGRRRRLTGAIGVGPSPARW